MKWFLYAFCYLTEGLSVLQPQIMPDPLVQICAYWTSGGRNVYEAREEKFKVDDQGNTTLVYRQSERRVFEILSQIKDRYKICLAEIGPLFGIANPETLVAQAKVSITSAARVMWETMPSAERKNFPIQNFRKYMERTFFDPSGIIDAVDDDLGRMYFFHRTRQDSTQVYKFDETFAPLLGGWDSLQEKTLFWIDSRLTDPYRTVCNTYTEADDSILQFVIPEQFVFYWYGLRTDGYGHRVVDIILEEDK